jgi:hypothetical protein
MKRILLIINILLTNLTFSYSQSEEYKTSMQEIVDSLHAMKWGTDLTPYANQLERIASAETKEWLPNYWAAFCYMLKSYSEPMAEKKDILLEKAESLIASAEKQMPNNDEIETLKAHMASARMAVDPQSRWQKYGAIVGEKLIAANKLNPENPRIKLLEASSIFYTPEAFGGGKKKALPIIKSNLEQFEKFKPTSPIMPNWGLNTAKYILGEAEK